MLLLSLLAHHAEPGDPVLLEWLNHQLDAIMGLGPITMVIILGLAIIAVPLAIAGLYIAQRPHRPPAE